MIKRKWIKAIFIVAYVVLVTYMAGKWAIRFAYLERGYEAVGGEYLFIPMVAWVAYKAISVFLDLLEDRNYADGDHQKAGSGGTAEMQDNK